MRSIPLSLLPYIIKNDAGNESQKGGGFVGIVVGGGSFVIEGM